MKSYGIKKFKTRDGITMFGITADGACVCVPPFETHLKAQKYIRKIKKGFIMEPVSEV